MPRDSALALAREKELDLIEIAPTAKPPVVRIMKYDKFRYQKEKDERKKQQAQKNKEMKRVRITPRAAINDLQIKSRRIDGFLKDGHNVEVGIFLKGREKYNKPWALKKLEDFLTLITETYQKTSEPKQGGRGYIVQISKKK
ncbi:MAG: translation initiation factor IF-3 [Candidatus Jorgensenbacteria bacterium GW2011_GWA2_45_9]|nr:MAG: translation initiation factor IF-3 [Candidatus Jorgensenbacteria bacterium GW2011_GWA2_45_9]